MISIYTNTSTYILINLNTLVGPSWKVTDTFVSSCTRIFVIVSLLEPLVIKMIILGKSTNDLYNTLKNGLKGSLLAFLT